MGFLCIAWEYIQYTFHFHHSNQKLIIRPLRVLQNFLETTFNTMNHVFEETTSPRHFLHIESPLILWFKRKLWTPGNSKRDAENLAAVLKVWALSDTTSFGIPCLQIKLLKLLTNVSVLRSGQDRRLYYFHKCKTWCRLSPYHLSL